MRASGKQCLAITRAGKRCQKLADGADGLCWTHAPENAAERRRAASKGGKARHDQEVRDLKDEIRAIISEVKSGEIDRNDALALFTGYRTLKDYLQLERDASILPDLSDRIEELKRERRHAG